MDDVKGKQPPKATQPVPRIQTVETVDVEHKKSVASFLAVIVLAILIFVGGFYALKYFKGIKETQKSDTKTEAQTTLPEATTKPQVTTPAPVETPPAKTPETNGLTVKSEVKEPDKVVEEFYNWYKNYSGDPIADGAYKTQDALSEDLVKKIESSSDKTDPFLCTNDKPADIEVEPAVTSGDSSNVVVNVKDGRMIPVKINLKLNGAWKMISVTCLSADGERSLLENLKLETGLDYTTVIDTKFFWSLPDYKGRSAITVNGKGFSTTNTDVSSETIKNFFTKNGFKTDSYNVSGYKKDYIVCIDSGKTNTDNKYDVKIDCGKISFNY